MQNKKVVVSFEYPYYPRKSTEIKINTKDSPETIKKRLKEISDEMMYSLLVYGEYKIKIT